MKEKDSEAQNEVEQLKEPFKDSSLLKLEMEKLELSERLQESLDEVKSVAKERADLQRLQEFLQSEKNQLQENLREMAAKVGVILFHVCVCEYSVSKYLGKN